MTYQIVLDQWEGSGNIDEVVLKAAGVAGVITRINDMNGGHHLDAGFKSAWEQSSTFAIRSCYFVYNPWVSGEANFNWYKANVPSDMPKRMFLDVEVTYKNYSPKTYGAQVLDCCKRLKDAGYIPTIYTGGWFLSYLSSWPIEFDYWWARYPTAVYPSAAISISWSELITKLQALAWNPSGGSKTPGTIKLWQCSADRYVLPGCDGHPMDVSLFPGSFNDLKSWFGLSTITEDQPALSDHEKLELLWNAHPELHPV